MRTSYSLTGQKMQHAGWLNKENELRVSGCKLQVKKQVKSLELTTILMSLVIGH